MPTPIAPRILLSQNACTELQTVVRAHSTPQSLALRARIVLKAAELDRPTNLKIGHDLGCSNLTVGQWRRRYLALGFPGLQDAIRAGRPRTIAAPLVDRSSRWPAHCPKHRIAPSPDGPWMRLWPPCLRLCTPMGSAAQASGVSFKTLISNPTRVRTGSTATMRTLMSKPTISANCMPKRLRPTSKTVW